MSRQDRWPRCPNCKTDLQFDEVDIGVGMIRSPAWCPDPDCGYSENACGLVEPDGRAPATEVPHEHDLARTWAEVPMPPAPNERQLEDELHEAINPPASTPNPGLAYIGSRAAVARIIEVLRQRGLIHG